MRRLPREIAPPRRIWLAAAAWTVVVTVVALILRAENNLPLPRALLSTGGWYYPLAALVWAACALDVRWRSFDRTLAQRLLIHVSVGTAVGVLWFAFVTLFARVTVGPAYWRLVFSDWMFQLLTTAMIYAAGVGIGLTVQSVDREHARREREAQLEVLAREAELTAVKAQLQPHFLFNALNSILALMEHDPAEARHMLIRLSSLLHSVFDRLDEPLVPLDRELDTIRDYLDIERIRFGDRMSYTIEAESAARRVAVPPFLLQPIVENAVRHGIEPHPGPGAVRVTGRLDGARLRLSVADTGSGNGATGASTVHGRGLALTRRRLQTVYGGGTAVIRTERTESGFTVTIEIPVTADVA